MSQVETVALWAGLISSIAGIVLSIVAILFAIWVNNRASEINNQMIRSLQKIESSVERVSTDTRELISAGWNKMLGAYGRESEAESTNVEAANQISSGLASEVRSELLEGGHEEPDARIARLEETLRDLQSTVAAQLRLKPSAQRADSLDSIILFVSDLPVEAKALLLILTKSKSHHLNRKQYMASLKDPVLRSPMIALRSRGLLVPLEGIGDDGKAAPVYYLPPGISRQVALAVRLAGDVPTPVIESVTAALREVGYFPDVS